MAKHRWVQAWLLAMLVVLLSCPPEVLSADSATKTTPWKMLLAPYVLGNSDDGLLGGIGWGLSLPETHYFLLGAEASSRGAYRANIKGEWSVSSQSRLVGEFDIARRYTALYPVTGGSPDPTVIAFERYIEVNGSLLRRYGQLEAGPALFVRKSVWRDAKDADENPIPLAPFDRLQPAGIGLGGFHVRWRTTNPTRPLHGWLIDTRLQAGVVQYDPWQESRFELHAHASLARAQKLSESVRLYLRAKGRFQIEAPPSLREEIGGDHTVRGELGGRDAGRRIIAGRSEVHWRIHDGLRWPMEVMHWVFPIVPVHSLEVELVPFYDVGAAGDPDSGWARTRQGAGLGVRVVLPPELVVRIDLARSFQGGTGFYFSIGETL
ncbi:hypothetical protein KQI63_11550 [bacterium]|nr:hypothetical protein [bacterium]